MPVKPWGKLREVTEQLTLPPDACPTFRAMYEELQRMEVDLHQHIHLENNILFPRGSNWEDVPVRRNSWGHHRTLLHKTESVIR